MIDSDIKKKTVSCFEPTVLFVWFIHLSIFTTRTRTRPREKTITYAAAKNSLSQMAHKTFFQPSSFLFLDRIKNAPPDKIQRKQFVFKLLLRLSSVCDCIFYDWKMKGLGQSINQSLKNNNKSISLSNVCIPVKHIDSLFITRENLYYIIFCNIPSTHI